MLEPLKQILMKKFNILLCLLFLLGFFVFCAQRQTVRLKVLQLNLWIQGRIVPGGVGGIIDIIDQTNPDIVFLCEIRKEEDNPFIDNLKEELKKRIRRKIATKREKL